MSINARNFGTGQRYGFAPGAVPIAGNLARSVFSQVMGLVALTTGTFALGAYIGQNLSGGFGIVFFLIAFGTLFGLNAASRRGNQQLAVLLLLGFGLLLGLAMGPVLGAYARVEPAVLWEAGGATALFVAGLGAFGYSIRTDLSPYRRFFFWALLALILVGIIAIFISIPHFAVLWSIAGLVIFGGFVVFDFNRLRNAGGQLAVPIAASIFLDILNIFQFFLILFSGNERE
jgi:modulator of FtsH protease